ncbi:B3/B4 domain-containing protein [Caviibacter abscessus]|uniref:B3/B4 domain-containing protein n=1 Tax=Caviibacter abscessus TaxID=1766719 RepID=UPI00082C7EA6|nr:B3/4 domain-containing protein [Caviibacter abscessus]
MKKFIIEQGFFDIFPDAKLGIVVCKGINNNIIDENKYKYLLDESYKIVPSHLPNPDFSSNNVIKVYREAFQKFKTKKGARSSIEALLKRVNNGGTIGNINPLVDIYNSVSLKYALPCGGEDIDEFLGDIRLTLANGTESFITLGSDKSEPPYENEIVYKDNEGAICRCLNWRECVRTILTEKTKNAFLCIELIDTDRIDILNVALMELKTLIDTNLGGVSEIEILDINNREIIIEE